MTPSEREEIEKSVDRIMDKIMDLIDNDGRLSIDAEPIIAAEILTQVEKARAEENERCAKIAEDYKGVDHPDVLRHGKFIANRIRNKIEKE